MEETKVFAYMNKLDKIEMEKGTGNMFFSNFCSFLLQLCYGQECDYCDGFISTRLKI